MYTSLVHTSTYITFYNVVHIPGSVSVFGSRVSNPKDSFLQILLLLLLLLLHTERVN